MKIWNKITNEPWATTSDTLENIINIAQRQNANPAAIAAQLGRKLQNTYAVSIRNNVAIIPIRGPLFRYANIFTAISGATSYELLARDFNSALVDESVKAILFDIDSPGGEVNGCSELADMIYNARGKKPIIAYASGNCCSGAYWIIARIFLVMMAIQVIHQQQMELTNTCNYAVLEHLTGCARLLPLQTVLMAILVLAMKPAQNLIMSWYI